MIDPISNFVLLLVNNIGVKENFGGVKMERGEMGNHCLLQNNLRDQHTKL